MNLLLLAAGYVTIAVLSVWLLKLRDDRRKRKIAITIVPAEGDFINGSKEPLIIYKDGSSSSPGIIFTTKGVAYPYRRKGTLK